MGKNTDKLGTIEGFKAPWETPTGADAEIDSAKLKTFLFNLMVDKAKAEDAAEDANEAVAKAQQELTEKAAEFAKGDTTGELGKVQAKLAEAETNAAKAQGALDRLTVGIEAGLTPKQAARLQGSTVKELEKDAAELLETFGVKKDEPPVDETDDEREAREEAEAEAAEANGGRTTPRTSLTLVNPGDAESGGGREFDYDKIAAEIHSGGMF